MRCVHSFNFTCIYFHTSDTNDIYLTVCSGFDLSMLFSLIICRSLDPVMRRPLQCVAFVSERSNENTTLSSCFYVMNGQISFCIIFIVDEIFQAVLEIDFC